MTRMQVPVEARFRRVQQRHVRGALVAWRAWMVDYREELSAAVTIQQTWAEYRKRYKNGLFWAHHIRYRYTFFRCVRARVRFDLIDFPFRTA